LANGFQVFNRSISDVQFRVESLEREISLRMFREGAHEVDELAEHVAAELMGERQKLDEQHALDGLSQLIDAGDEVVRAIDASEEDEAAVAADIEPWIRQVLGLRMEPVGDPDAQAIQITWAGDTLLPDVPWRSTLEQTLHRRWTWRRRQSIQKRRPRSSLLRPGAAFIEVLERVALWDDRGIAYATLRVEPGWPGVWRGFRLVWLLEPALDSQSAVYSRARSSELARRAEAFLPTLTVEQYVDEDGTPVNEPELIAILSRPYQQQRDPTGRQDRNLGSRPEELREVIGQSQFVALVEHVTTRARGALLDTFEVTSALAAAREACEKDGRKAQRGLEVRSVLAAVHPGLVEKPLPEELADLATLRHSVSSPSVRLDEIGFFVITATAPE
jgi:ATP-dependent helicase HepA